MSYWRFAAMIATSTIVMFILMYLNTFLVSHLFFSETRAYMAVVMGATMAVIMLAFMLSMYTNKSLNIGIFVGSIVVFTAALWLVRSQTTVDDVSFMRAMIPHHSIAIMTSSRANIEDSRVKKLADEIIYAQDKEIAEMRYLISSIEASGIVEKENPTPPPQIMGLDRALSTANTATMDAGFLTDNDIGMAYPDGRVCAFKFTPHSPPSLVTGSSNADQSSLIKISGNLVELKPAETADGPTWVAPGISVMLGAVYGNNSALQSSDNVEATMLLKLDTGLEAGYQGFFGCN